MVICLPLSCTFSNPISCAIAAPCPRVRSSAPPDRMHAANRYCVGHILPPPSLVPPTLHKRMVFSVWISWVRDMGVNASYTHIPHARSQPSVWISWVRDMGVNAKMHTGKMALRRTRSRSSSSSRRPANEKERERHKIESKELWEPLKERGDRRLRSQECCCSVMLDIMMIWGAAWIA